MKVSGSLACLAILLGASATAQPDDDSWRDAATVYAILNSNEWCWGGSVHVDLWSGDYTLLPRPLRSDCHSSEPSYRPIERGTIGNAGLSALRASYRRVIDAGMELEECELILSNGGPEVLAIAGPKWSFISPEAEGCWSHEARTLHRALFDIFGEQRPSLPTSSLEGRRTIPD